MRSGVKNLFDRDALKDYLCELGKDLGFKTIKNYRRGVAHIDCAWMDGKRIYAGMNIEFGNDREIAGALAELMIVSPEVAVLITAANPLKPITRIFDMAKAIAPGRTTIVVDIKSGNVMTKQV